MLVVDDDPNARDGLSRMLGDRPYRVVVATDATTALDLMSRDAIDVVLSDEKMPGMKGTELLARVASEHPETVRILLTGHASLDIAKSAINQGGVFRLLEKPCSTESLRRAIDAALEQKLNNPTSEPAPESHRELDVLSRREREVVDLLLKGPRIAHVAKRLYISEHTVRNHLKAVFRKLNIHSQTELVERYGNSL